MAVENKPAPVFTVNATVLVTLNDEMARSLVSHFAKCVADKAFLDKPVYAFYRALEKDLEPA